MILVVGATGTLGGEIAHQLLDAGHPVRILVRPSSDYEGLVEAGAQPVMGDLKDRSSLDAACEDIDTVITTANSGLRGGNDNIQSVEREGNRNLIEAAKANEVKQFMFTSFLGEDINSPVPFLQAKAEAAEYLRTTGLPYTILRPNYFMDMYVPLVVGRRVMADEPVILVSEGQREHAYIAIRDVAEFAVAAIGNDAAMNEDLLMAGPEAFSWRDCVATYERVLGRSIPVQTVEPGEPIPGIENPVILGTLYGLETHDTRYDMSDTADTYGVDLTTLEEFVRQQVSDGEE